MCSFYSPMHPLEWDLSRHGFPLHPASTWANRQISLWWCSIKLPKQFNWIFLGINSGKSHRYPQFISFCGYLNDYVLLYCCAPRVWRWPPTTTRLAARARASSTLIGVLFFLWFLVFVMISVLFFLL